jgi:hypothetical protein
MLQLFSPVSNPSQNRIESPATIAKVSQPFAGFPSQSAKPWLQVNPQVPPGPPATQVAVALAGAGQVVAQFVPQPVLHVYPHRPLEHVAVPPGGAGHGAHEPPQLEGEVLLAHDGPQA